MSDLTPITREEALLDGADLEPITRKEQFIKRIYDKTREIPEPITREEWFLRKAGEGTSPVTIEQLNVTENGTYSEEGKAYSPVIVEVPEPTLITKTITANGTYTASDDNADGYSQVTVAVDGFKKKSIANTPTDIASFNDGTANPMPSLEISIVPVQSGSGDPSPSNVRPISGWSGAKVTRCGVNLWDEVWEVGGINHTTGQNTETTGVIRSKNYIRVDGNTDYNFVMKTGPIDFHVHWYDANKNFISYVEVYSGGSANYRVATSPQNAVYMRFNLTAGYGTTYNNDISINYPATDTSYHAYNGSTLSIPFHDSSDNPITVYGGTLNVTSGELRVDRAMVDLGTRGWTYYASGSTIAPYFYAYANALNIKYEGAFSTTTYHLLCSQYKTVARNVDSFIDGTICVDGAVNDQKVLQVQIKDSRFTDAESFMTAMNGVQLVYELTTPQTCQLTPAQVSTLLGQNNIFADCGQILEGEYFVTL